MRGPKWPSQTGTVPGPYVAMLLRRCWMSAPRGNRGGGASRVAQVFDVAGVTKNCGCLVPSRFLRRAELGMPAPSRFDHVSTAESDGARSIAAHPFDRLRAGSCKRRKDGARSARMERMKIAKEWRRAL
jgi:hypothetical protein